MSEFEKMRAGEIYNPRDLKLIYMYDKTARRLHRYNKRCFHVYNMRSRLMKKIINTSGNFWIHPPFQCDYGCNIYLGKQLPLGIMFGLVETVLFYQELRLAIIALLEQAVW